MNATRAGSRGHIVGGLISKLGAALLGQHGQRAAAEPGRVVSQINWIRIEVVVIGYPIGLQASGAVSSSDGTRPNDRSALRAVVTAACAKAGAPAIVGVSA